MNIKELNSFKMSDAVEFHDTLNQKIFNNEKLKPTVRNQLLLIAKDFINEMGISELHVKDITISGSNAAYSYTKHSDLDLHILVDMTKLSSDEIYQELFNAKKILYNENYNITVHGIPVELYVQDSNEPVVSLGEYSVKNDEWIKLPKKRRANLDQHATRLKYEKLKAIVLTALQATKSSQVEKVTKKIRQYRQAGLDKGGEFSPENLAYKVLRSQGYITKLYDLRNRLHGQELTIETMYKQAFDEDATLQYASEKTPVISPYSGIKDNQYRGSISEMPETSGPIGVQPGGWRNYKPKTTEDVSGNKFIFYRGEPILSPDRLEQLKSSIGKPYPILRKEGSPSHIGTYMLPDRENAEGYVKQALAGKGKGGTVTKIEVDVNSFKNGDGGVDQAVIITNIAGLVSKQDPDPKDPLRINDRKKSMVYYLGPGVKKYLNDPYLNDPELVNKWYDPEFAKRMWDIIKSGKQAVTKPGENQIQERMIKILGPLAEKIRRDPEVINYFLRHSPKDWVERNFRMNSDGSGTKVIDVQYFPPVTKEGASGYIPSNAEKNDPRFKTALTVDVKPNSLQKNAKAFGFKVKRTGVPPTLKT